MRIFATILFTIYFLKTIAQPLDDRQLILDNPTTEIPNIKRTPYFGFSTYEKWYQRYNPITVSAASLLFVYQKFVSPQISATCGFYPSCSAMSKNLISEFGLFKGIFCTADRLTRCNKICFAELEVDEIDPKDGKVHEDNSRYK